MEKHTLFELHEHIRRVLALNLPELLWISCEIAQANDAKGHCFLSLVQKDDATDEVVAQAEAVVWQRQMRQLKRRIGGALPSLLREGMQVLLHAQVDFNERYGLKLVIHDIDPTYTLGQLEMHRRATLERLKAEGLIGKNTQTILPVVLQRIAVISSERAAGLQDYLHHLQENSYGYQFDCRLFPAAVQGRQVEEEALQQLAKISRQAHQFDCVAIIRGGGARLDLSAFDGYALCRAVAEMPLPVLSGIGHEVDEVLLDKAVYAALKTPTAVADFLINHNLQFESSLLQTGQQLSLAASRQLHEQAVRLERIEQSLRFLPEKGILQQQQLLNSLEHELKSRCRFRLKEEHQQLGQLEQLTRLLSPEATLARGFTLTFQDGKLLRSARELEKGSRITTRFHDGEVDSERTD